MSLQTRLSSLITAIGADVKSLNTKVDAAPGNAIVWKTGDPTPSPVPSGARYIFNLGFADTLPAWAPTGSIVIRS